MTIIQIKTLIIQLKLHLFLIYYYYDPNNNLLWFKNINYQLYAINNQFFYVSNNKDFINNNFTHRAPYYDDNNFENGNIQYNAQTSLFKVRKSEHITIM